VGRAFCLTIIATLFGYAFFYRHWFKEHPRADAIWLGLHAAIVGGLAAGVFDHYLFNLEFQHAVTGFWLLIGLATAATRLGVATAVAEQTNSISLP
jgi:RsiW-degrading membrane proteinase PrsW (M82 family)